MTAHKTGPIVAILPRADDAAPVFGGFDFAIGETPPHEPGLFVLTRRVGDLLYPVLIGEGEDIALAIEALLEKDQAAAGAFDGSVWMTRTQPRQRTHIARDLIGKYHPPLNVEHRKGPAVPEIAAFIPDRYVAAESSDFGSPPVGSVVASEEELARLVQAFYAAARADPVIGPVFNRSVADWDAHAAKVQDFWSRAMLGTRRYNGTPFTPHLFLGLKPEHFERWISLFKTTAATVLRPDAAAFAVSKVEHMGRCFRTGLFLPPIGDAAKASVSAG